MSGPVRGNAVFTVVVTFAVLLCAVPMTFVVAASNAPSATVLAALLAAVPVGPIIACLLWLDRYEPEPRRLLAGGLLWGVFVATAVALLLEGVGGFVGGISDNRMLEIGAPVAEEASKGLFLLLLLWWRRAELDGVLDGIVYAGMVGVGFAFTENILYLASSYNGSDTVGPGGIKTLTGTFVLRCLVSPFAHPLFTACTGVGVGIAVGSRRRSTRILAPVAGYVCAVLAHAVWNTSTVYGPGNFVTVYLILMAPLFLACVALAVWVRRWEGRMLAGSLADAARRGMLPETDIAWVVDLGARRRSRAYARDTGGETGERAMRAYQQSVIELGFLHSRFLRGVPPPDFAERGHDYVARISALRPTIAFPGQVVPIR
ncbi:MAG TPA: PrsW family intramembrane metalloprotease [Nocardioides sp.]|jgi:RsiW-degrading membrane proteinase PrsW (M82 family)|uniref:PrsW family intramembrane metalloprotease n=1 Tax=Nocardioides sp. TaxID=35761 RepID=UPI002E350D04|nr:PrsW family intramembrane metalloprotease [Nocardioides sp.]HEX3929244.1 PrsW family intramembrane metalloprotease [Nocardioides sp.]